MAEISDDPRSTWGRSPELKLKWREQNVPDENPDEAVFGHPTETGAHDDALFDVDKEREYSERQAAEAQRANEGQSTGQAETEPVKANTVDGQENTANDSSSTGGADVSRSAAPDPNEASGAVDEMTVEKSDEGF